MHKYLVHACINKWKITTLTVGLSLDSHIQCWALQTGMVWYQLKQPQWSNKKLLEFTFDRSDINTYKLQVYFNSPVGIE